MVAPTHQQLDTTYLVELQAQIVRLLAMLGTIFLEALFVSAVCLVSILPRMQQPVAHAPTHLPLDTTHLVEPQAPIVSLLVMLGIIFLVVLALPAHLVSILLSMQPAVAHVQTHLQLVTTNQVERQAQTVCLLAMLGTIFLEVLVSSAFLVSIHMGMSIAVAHALTLLPLDTTHLVEPQAQIV